jgi:hypothetical protein
MRSVLCKIDFIIEINHAFYHTLKARLRWLGSEHIGKMIYVIYQYKSYKMSFTNPISTEVNNESESFNFSFCLNVRKFS